MEKLTWYETASYTLYKYYNTYECHSNLKQMCTTHTKYMYWYALYTGIIWFLVFLHIDICKYHVLFTKRSQLMVHLLAYSWAFDHITQSSLADGAQFDGKIGHLHFLGWNELLLLVRAVRYGWKLQNKRISGPWAEIVLSRLKSLTHIRLETW